MKVILLHMVSAPPPITMGWLNLNICQKFMIAIFFLHLWQDKPLWLELEMYGGVLFITTLPQFYYFISLEIAITQKSVKCFF